MMVSETTAMVLRDCTLIIPTRNRGAELRETVKYLCDAGLRDMPVIIVDDCSDREQECPEAVSELTNCRVIRQAHRTGQAQARNVGLRAATTGMCLFLDDDAHIETVPELATFLEGPLEEGVAIWRFETIRSYDGYRDGYPEDMLTTRLHTFIGFGVLMHRERVLSVGGYRELLCYRHEEADLARRLFRAGFEIRYEPGVRFIHRHTAAARDDREYDMLSVRNVFLLDAMNLPLLTGVPLGFARACRLILGNRSNLGARLRGLVDGLFTLARNFRERTPMTHRQAAAYARLRRRVFRLKAGLPIRVWVLTNSPSPYQVEFFRALHASPELSVDVRFMRGTHRGDPSPIPTDAGFGYRVMNGLLPSCLPDAVRLHCRALIDVVTRRHDVYVLSGQYTSPTFLACAALCSRKRSLLLWLERPWPAEYRPGWATRVSARVPGGAWLRNRVLRRLVRSADGVLAMGSDAAATYGRLASTRDRVCMLPYHCDVSRFAPSAVANAEAFRRERGWVDPVIFLYSGTLVPRKAPEVLLEAFQRLAADREAVALIVLGDGRMRERLEADVAPANRQRVYFAGHVDQAELPAWFAAADVFVMPSRHDGWGVVINEACGAGLPVIATRRTGAALDLVEEGVNGYRVERDDPAALYARMRELAEDASRRMRMGKHSLGVAARYTLEHGVRRFRRALDRLV